MAEVTLEEKGDSSADPVIEPWVAWVEDGKEEGILGNSVLSSTWSILVGRRQYVIESASKAPLWNG